MRMTIDDAIRYFKDMEKACCCGTEQATIAIETMRKYQKIQKIVKAWNDMNSFYSMKQISEVMNND